MTSAPASARAAPLEIVEGVRPCGEGMEALSQTPWLRLPPAAFAPGGFVEMRYAASFYDAPVRPLLRFWRRDGSFREHILPAPYEGSALWLGRTPLNTVDVWISPTNRTGPFDFRIESLRKAPFCKLLGRLARAPKRTFFALSAGMVGLADEADLNWRFALGAEPLENYPVWRAARRRDIDPTFDRPRGDWRATFAIIIDPRGADAGAVAHTVRSIEAQNYPHRRVTLIEGDAPPDLSGADLVLMLRAGDALAPYACASLADFFARNVQSRLAYADAIVDGLLDARPGWSPVMHGFRNFVGRAACARASLLSGMNLAGESAEGLFDRLLDGAGLNEVGAVHRPLFELAAPSAPLPRAPMAPAQIATTRRVSIIIPTRDRVDLLAPCVESVLQKTGYPNYDVTIVDNGSVDPRTHALFEKLRADARVKILPRPGPFNFSSLCNDGAREAPGEFLLFLNNDTEIVSSDWVERLVSLAARPDIGAVGAKLLYADGRVQHVGVLIGMGGVAGHFGSGLSAGAPGWQGRNAFAHETSAVTAACLAVERSKFDAIGGFDAAHLPIELNDVDLCLRLAARGWRALCDAQTTLIHHESASRGGGGLRLQRVHAGERQAFCDRWRALIRDDPYFHPGLSLYAQEPKLP